MEINKNILNENKVIVSPQENIDFANSNELKEELISIKEEGYNQIEKLIVSIVQVWENYYYFIKD